jgi:hypothetical protein
MKNTPREVLNAWERAYRYACRVAMANPASVDAQRNVQNIYIKWELAKLEYLPRTGRNQ